MPGSPVPITGSGSWGPIVSEHRPPGHLLGAASVVHAGRPPPVQVRPQRNFVSRRRARESHTVGPRDAKPRSADTTQAAAHMSGRIAPTSAAIAARRAVVHQARPPCWADGQIGRAPLIRLGEIWHDAVPHRLRRRPAGRVGGGTGEGGLLEDADPGPRHRQHQLCRRPRPDRPWLPSLLVDRRDRNDRRDRRQRLDQHAAGRGTAPRGIAAIRLAASPTAWALTAFFALQSLQAYTVLG